MEARKTFRVVVGDVTRMVDPTDRVCVDIQLRGSREGIEAFQTLFLDRFLNVEFPADIVDAGTYQNNCRHLGTFRGSKCEECGEEIK